MMAKKGTKILDYEGVAYVRPMMRGIVLREGEYDGEDLDDLMNMLRWKHDLPGDGDVILRIEAWLQEESE